MRKQFAESSFSDSLFNMVGTTEGRIDAPILGNRHFNVRSPQLHVECQECGKKFRSRDPQDCPQCGGSDLEVV